MYYFWRHKWRISEKSSGQNQRLDAGGWRKMLTSKVFGSCTSDVRKAIAEFIKHTASLQKFIAGRLAPLDKNPGLWPIGVGEVLRRIAGKVAMSIVKDDVTKACGNLQLRGGQDAGWEAAIYSMHNIFGKQDRGSFTCWCWKRIQFHKLTGFFA